jgi:hypothetical protein
MLFITVTRINFLEVRLKEKRVTQCCGERGDVVSDLLEGLTALFMGIGSLVTAALGLRAALGQAAQTASKDLQRVKHIAEEISKEASDATD